MLTLGPGRILIRSDNIKKEPKKVGLTINERSRDLAIAIVDKQYNVQPGFWEKYGEAGRKLSIRDVGFHLSYLSEAMGVSDPSLFADYIAWVKVLFRSLNFPDSVLPEKLKIMQEVLEEQLPEEMKPIVGEYIVAGFERLDEMPDTEPSFIDEKSPGGALAKQCLDMLLKNDRRAAYELIMKAVNEGMSIRDIYLKVFQATQYEIGRLWQINCISVAQEHYCTAATQLIMAQLYPWILSSEKNGHRLVAACVGEELHEIGLRMVADFFEMDGWDTIYVGANTPTRSIIQTINEHRADVLAISATTTFHLSSVRELINAVKADPLARNVKILVGGYVFNQSRRIWRSLGADGYAIDAREAVELANKLVGD
jgi:methylmalonyl-CoA mutase cobalamin-binding domain/chain